MEANMIKQFIADAFTDKVFHGNPAAICLPERWPDEKLMQDIASENRLSETAFREFPAVSYSRRQEAR